MKKPTKAKAQTTASKTTTSPDVRNDTLATRKKVALKTSAKSTRAKSAVASSRKKKEAGEAPAAANECIANLQKRLNDALADYGTLLEAMTNLRLKIDVMLGQFLKGLYVIGITPDDIVQKCQQMFRKKVSAD